MGEAWLCNHGVINNDRSQCVKCAAAGDTRTPNVVQMELTTLRESLAAKEEECSRWLDELDKALKKLTEGKKEADAAAKKISDLQQALYELMRPFPSEDMAQYLSVEMVTVEVEWGAVKRARSLLPKK